MLFAHPLHKSAQIQHVKQIAQEEGSVIILRLLQNASVLIEVTTAPFVLGRQIFGLLHRLSALHQQKAHNRLPRPQ